MRRVVVLLATCLLAAPASAEPVAVIQEIAFEGNKVTQPVTMLREMPLTVGDPADAGAIERSRQGVQDLGLFREVSVRQEPVEGGVRLVFKVKEKFYILPLPRADVSSDGGYAYGVQVRWSNLWGLNHSTTPFFERRQSSEGAGDPEIRGVQNRARLNYVAPYALGTRYTVAFSVAYYKIPYLEPLVYDQVEKSVGISIGRKLTNDPGSQGWHASVGLSRRQQDLTGPDAAFVRSEGRAIAVSGGLSYRDLRFNIYSDEGSTSEFQLETFGRDYGSDYHSTIWNLDQAWYLKLGDTPHQTFHVIGTLGARHGGSPGAQEYFSLGGVQTLRGYEPEIAQGDAVYLLRMEFLRPVFRKSIRALVSVDAGNAFERPRDANFGKVLVSAGFGVRFRIQAVVNLDVDIGVAWPLSGGGGMRFFAGRV